MYDFYSKLVVCGLLIYSTFVSTPEQAIAVFTSKRFEPTLTPSQVRTMVRRWARSAFSFRSFIIRVRFFQMFFFLEIIVHFPSISFVFSLNDRSVKALKKRWFNIIVSSGKKVSFYQQKISFFRECKRSFVFFFVSF